MRFLLYNIRYGTGCAAGRAGLQGYLRKTGGNLSSIISFIKDVKPDIAGLVEVDGGSYRSSRKSQAEIIAKELGHYHSYGCKYGDAGLARLIPVIGKQGNAFLTRDGIKNQQFHYFSKGVKRLVIELELSDMVIFLVHLSLGFKVRHHQLGDLHALVGKTKKPHIVAGDFNLLYSGSDEIRLFCAATGLKSVNENGLPSFPSSKPMRQLDFILYSPDLVVKNFTMPNVRFSDHLPLVCDFEHRA